MVKYEDSFTAHSALEWFSGKEFKGKVIKVSISQGYKPAPAASDGYGVTGGYGGGGGGGGYGGSSGGGGGYGQFKF